jgi:hypothetical protein
MPIYRNFFIAIKAFDKLGFSESKPNSATGFIFQMIMATQRQVA